MPRQPQQLTNCRQRHALELAAASATCSKWTRRQPARPSATSGKLKKGLIRDAHSAQLPPPSLLLLVLLALSWIGQPLLACQQVATRWGTVCECTPGQAQCGGQLHFEWPQDDASLLRMVSNEAGARWKLDKIKLADQEQVGAAAAASSGDPVHFRLLLDINKRHQQVVGYGGAFTDSAAMLIKRGLDEGCREQLMRSYFAPRGLSYNLVRVPIGGTDMSTRPYSYDDLPMSGNGDKDERRADFELRGFRLQDEDFSYKLPLIKWAQRLRPREQPLRLLASSWSAPNWMKSNHKLVQGRLKDDDHHHELGGRRPGRRLGPQNRIDGRYYDAYARYIIRFLDEYEAQLGNGTRIWALTPQNEPCTPSRLGLKVVNYNSVNFTPEQIGRFVRSHLVPNLLRHNRTARDMALFVWDDTLLGLDQYKDHLFRRPPPSSLLSWQRIHSLNSRLLPLGDSIGENKINQEEEEEETTRHQMFEEDEYHVSNEYVRGIALHWYSQGLDKVPYRALYDLRRWLPGKFSLLSTEASFIGRPQPGNWSRGERYARDIIMNLRAGGLGWIDWNLALDEEGGPTWSGNYLDAAILVKPHTGGYLMNPMFHAIGHLSRFISAHSHVVESELWRYTPASSLTNGSQASGEWLYLDEFGEQLSEVLAVASEQHELGRQVVEGQARTSRRMALVLLNRAASPRRVSLSVLNCAASRLFGPSMSAGLQLELTAKSITSLAFNC